MGPADRSKQADLTTVPQGIELTPRRAGCLVLEGLGSEREALGW